MALAVGALAASVIVPTAHGAPPAPEREQVLVVGADGGVATIDVTRAELAARRADPAGGTVVERGRVVHPELAQSVPKVGAPSLWAGGERGAGKVIVVIDTGVLPSFGGSLVGQACFAATQVGPGLQGHCGTDREELAAFDGACFDLGVCRGDDGDVLDPAAARPCVPPAGDAEDCYHGTAVAAVAARHEPTPGVAPDAGVYAIQVFDPTGGNADLVDLMLALDHVRELSDAGMDIAAVNLSVATSNTYATACDAGSGASAHATAFRDLFDELLARGIGNAVASGNSGALGGVALPACVSNALSVGSTDLDDHLADFGNRGPTLDLVAPGVDEGNGSLDRMEIPGSPQTEWAGTSFSAPHVAGAFALLGPQYPKASAVQLGAFLRSTGVPVHEAVTGATYPRLRLRPPAQALAAQVLFPASAAIGGTPRSGVGDLDGDGRDDVLAHAPGAATDRVAYGGDGWSLTNRSYAVTGSYTPLIGQLRGLPSGPEDILWYAPGSVPDFVWAGSPSRTFASSAVSISGTYTPLLGDYDGDGYDDVFWYAPGVAVDSIWFGGPGGFTSVGAKVTGSYRVAVGDFDGDGKDDLVFHGPNRAADSLWRGTAARGTWAISPLSMGGSYTQLVGDVNGDGSDDLVLYQAGARLDSIWRGGSGVGTAGATGGFSPLAIAVSATYQPVVGDVDGNGRADIVWYAPGSAPDFLWFGQTAGAPTSRAMAIGGSYVPRLGDLDGDAGDEIVWFDPTSTTTPVWWSYEPPADD
jgi:hypothetical protein